MSRWIDADVLIEAMGEEPYVWTDSAEEIAERNQWLTDMHIIEDAPSIDIVRCKECRWWIDNLTENDDDEAYDSCRWDWSRKIPTADDFCSYGEVRDAPSIDIEPRRGEWIPCSKEGLALTELMRREGRKWYGYKCSNCNFIYKGNALLEFNFCPNCGADMREREGE